MLYYVIIQGDKGYTGRLGQKGKRGRSGPAGPPGGSEEPGTEQPIRPGPLVEDVSDP